MQPTVAGAPGGANVEERIFLRESGVVVSNARFIVPTQTFAMAGITSVKTFREVPKRGGLILLMLFGMLLLLGGIGIAAGNGSGAAGAVVIAFGLLLTAAAIFAMSQQRDRFHLLLKTASGEAKALTSVDLAFIKRVVAGLNEAIVHRG
ncbi:MAG: hypothetical protein J0H86_22415 [Xanthomonadaceae bacterium]|nr:hypothetical protein [Xanthomonadaceae bacterium]